MKSFSIKSEAFIWMELERIMFHYMAICSTSHLDYRRRSKPKKLESLCSRVEWLAASTVRSFCLMLFMIAIMRITALLCLHQPQTCLLYTSDAADEEDSVDLG